MNTHNHSINTGNHSHTMIHTGGYAAPLRSFFAGIEKEHADLAGLTPAEMAVFKANDEAGAGGVKRAAMGSTLLAADGDKPGAIRALVSAYDVKYRIGYAIWHTIEMGAFANSLATNATIPFFWMHGWDWTDQVPVGAGTASEQADEGGLVADGRLYVEHDPEVARLHQSSVDGAIREWSIGYRVLASRRDPNDERHEIVTEAELLEASLVLRGANPATSTLKVAGKITGEPTAASSTLTRVTTAGGMTVDTSDPDLVARLVAAGGSAKIDDVKNETGFDGSALLAHDKVREVFGSIRATGEGN